MIPQAPVITARSVSIIITLILVSVTYVISMDSAAADPIDVVSVELSSTEVTEGEYLQIEVHVDPVNEEYEEGGIAVEFPDFDDDEDYDLKILSYNTDEISYYDEIVDSAQHRVSPRTGSCIAIIAEQRVSI